MNDTTHQGGRQCGGVRFDLPGPPQFVCNRHCRSCRKATRAALSTWVGFDDGKRRWTKAPPPFHAGSPGVKRGFCAACGAPITYAGAQQPGETRFLIGVLDNPSAFAPRKEVFTEDALSWALGRKE